MAAVFSAFYTVQSRMTHSLAKCHDDEPANSIEDNGLPAHARPENGKQSPNTRQYLCSKHSDNATDSFKSTRLKSLAYLIWCVCDTLLYTLGLRRRTYEWTRSIERVCGAELGPADNSQVIA